MGFSISASTAIIGVAILMTLEVSMGTVIPVLTDLDESYDDMRQRTLDELQTSIVISNITVQANASLHDLSIKVDNTGSTVIDSNYVHVLIDGVLSSFTSSESYWFPEQLVTLSVYGVSGSGSKIVKVVTNNGISDYKSYIA